MSDRSPRTPNIVIVFGDQWRAQAAGYAGNAVVRTPHLDRLADESVHFVNAVAGCPVCSPYRASLLTGQQPLTHGVFVNDVCLCNGAVSIAGACKRAGYETAYIGKWHVDGHGRSNYIPPERRQGFDFWEVLECTHQYNHSPYYAGDSDEKRFWDGYDAIAQTARACEYVRDHAEGEPFLLVLSWGPPHAPYETAPPRYRAMYDPAGIALRPNVPASHAEQARKDLAGYYAHCTALDDCLAQLRHTLAETGIDDNTVFLFTSDHGDMLGSQGHVKKQRPWDESIRVPFLLRYPAGLGEAARVSEKIIDAPDVMPTLLSLAGIEIPRTVEGADLSAFARGAPAPADDAALIGCYWPFGQYTRRIGGKEYRGLRTRQHTYARDLAGPWLLYDNLADPYQLDNLVNRPEAAEIQARLDARLQARLAQAGDEFLPGDEYVRRWGYVVDESGTVPYTN
ncbi:MAG TPA: sulfatase [Phycisphaerae bacterium]|nr:sulfatase [Phycisphaerae bacterium]